jgi:hypothetical protein
MAKNKKYKCIYKKYNGKYTVVLNKDKQIYYLGTFNNIEDGIEAYKNKEKELYKKNYNYIEPIFFRSIVIIPLSQNYRNLENYGRYFTIINKEDYEKVKHFNWHTRISKGGKMYARTNEKGKPIYMHRIIKEVKDRHTLIDHINSDGLDNRKSNLRLVDYQKNVFNMSKNKKAYSKYKGVDWVKIKKKWRARIIYNRKSFHLGYFTNEEEAGKRYNEKAKELFGEYAKLNVII